MNTTLTAEATLTSDLDALLAEHNATVVPLADMPEFADNAARPAFYGAADDELVDGIRVRRIVLPDGLDDTRRDQLLRYMVEMFDRAEAGEFG